MPHLSAVHDLGDTKPPFIRKIHDLRAARHEFSRILCRGKVSSFRRWVEKAEATGLEAIGRFVRHLRKDWAAVENAVRHAWSNGPVEGHINPLKMLKRQMYGRAKFELLRARTLPFTA